MVVISVISLLATVVLTQLGKARAKVLDVKYLNEAKEFQKALELYYLDNDDYPGSGGWASSCSDASATTAAKWVSLQAALSPYYSSTIAGGEWPFCLMYRDSPHANCDLVAGADYNLVFGTKEATFGLDVYSSNEGGSAERYCLYSVIG